MACQVCISADSSLMVCNVICRVKWSHTSLMLMVSVSSMVRRSMPIPQPPVGGRPYSRAVQKFSSTYMASTSPPAFACRKFRGQTSFEASHAFVCITYLLAMTIPQALQTLLQSGPLLPHFT